MCFLPETLLCMAATKVFDHPFIGKSQENIRKSMKIIEKSLKIIPKIKQTLKTTKRPLRRRPLGFSARRIAIGQYSGSFWQIYFRRDLLLTRGLVPCLWDLFLSRSTIYFYRAECTLRKCLNLSVIPWDLFDLCLQDFVRVSFLFFVFFISLRIFGSQTGLGLS